MAQLLSHIHHGSNKRRLLDSRRMRHWLSSIRHDVNQRTVEAGRMHRRGHGAAFRHAHFPASLSAGVIGGRKAWRGPNSWGEGKLARAHLGVANNNMQLRRAWVEAVGQGSHDAHPYWWDKQRAVAASRFAASNVDPCHWLDACSCLLDQFDWRLCGYRDG